MVALPYAPLHQVETPNPLSKPTHSQKALREDNGRIPLK